MITQDTNDLIARYLSAFESYLPAAQRADVTAELKDSIESQMEEREAELGRTLTSIEVGEVLRTYGPPIIAASRYWKQQQLIGPRWLPYYWQTLRTVLWGLLVFNVVALFAGFATNGNALQAFVRVWGLALGSLSAAVGIVTIVFALMERFGSRTTPGREWNPSTLPQLSEGGPVSQATSATELIVNAVIVLWLMNVAYVRDLFASLVLGPAASKLHTLPFGLAPVWKWGIVALLLASLFNAIVNATNLVRPDWTRLRAAYLTAANAVLLIVALLILRTRPLVVATNARMVQHPHTLELANAVMQWSLVLAALVCLWGVVCYGRKLYRLSHHRALRAAMVTA